MLPRYRDCSGDVSALDPIMEKRVIRVLRYPRCGRFSNSRLAPGETRKIFFVGLDCGGQMSEKTRRKFIAHTPMEDAPESGITSENVSEHRVNSAQ